MKRFAVGLLAAGVLGHCGCVGVRPVGPFADSFAMKPPPKKTGAAKDGAMPTLSPAPTPPAPALYVSPGEVSEATADEMAKKLEAELEADRKGMEAMPRYAEVSVVGKK